jgi:hypothetical protein
MAITYMIQIKYCKIQTIGNIDTGSSIGHHRAAGLLIPHRINHFLQVFVFINGLHPQSNDH